MATHSSILAWRIPWTEDPDSYSPWGCKRVGHDLMTKEQRQELYPWICLMSLVFFTYRCLVLSFLYSRSLLINLLYMY